MADRPTAADYLAEAQRNALASVPQQAPFDPDKIIPFGKSTQARHGVNDPLSWLVDILTRPLSGVTNTVQSMVNRATDTKLDVPGALLDFVAPGRHFLSGFFSTDPEQHRTFADVIEESTDRIGSRINPDYQNTRDNVNPWVKGGVGLALDIAADPITWIPGAQIAKAGSLVARGAQLAVKGGKGALDAVSGASRAAKIVDEAASEAGAQASKITRPSPDEALAHAGERVERSVLDDLLRQDPEAARIYQSHLDEVSRMSDDQFAKALDARLQSVVSKDLARQLAKPAGQAMREGLEALGPMTIRDIKRVPGVTAKSAKPAPLRTMAENRGPDGTPVPGWVEQIAELPVERLKFFGDRAPAVLNMAKAALSGDARALREIEKVYTHAYLPAFAQAKAQGRILGADFREIKPTKARTIKGAETVLDSLANFRRQIEQSRVAVEARLGKPLVQALARFDNAANFDKAVSRLKGIMDQSIDVTTLRRLAPTDVAALRQIGMNTDAIPTGLKPQATRNTEPLPQGETLAEQVARMGDEGQEVADAVRFATAALERTIFRDLDRANLAREYPLQTRTGTLRTDDQYGAGWGRNAREANTYFQYNLAKAVTEEVGSWITRTYGKSVGGAARAEIMSTNLRQALRLAERALDQQGVPLTIGVGPKRIPLSTSQILDVLDKVDHRATLWAFFNADTAVPWTNLSDAVYTALSGGTRGQIEQMLRQTSTRHIAADGRPKPLPNNMVQGGGRFGRGPRLQSAEMIAKLTDLIDKSRPVFNQVVADNAQALGARGIDETLEIADNVLSNLEVLKATPGATGELLESIAEVGTRATAIAKEFGMMKSSRDLGEAVVESIVPVTDQIIAKGSVDVTKLLEGIEAAEEAHRTTVKVTQKVYDDLVDADPFVAGGNVTDLGQKIDQVMGRGILGKVLPVFSRRAGAERIYPAWMRSENAFRTLTSRYHTRLSALSKAGLSREELANKLVNARNGVPTTDKVTLELRDLWGQMFGSGARAGALIDNAFFRNGNNVHHVNQLFEREGLEFVFDMEKATAVAADEGIPVIQAAARQAAEWEIKDPLDTLSKMYHSFVTLQTQQTLAQQFVRMAKSLGATSRAPKPGYSLAGNDSGRSIFAKYLPDDLYFRDDVLREMNVVDNLMQQTMELKGPFGTFVREVYQPLQQAWKYGMTLPNPTHHIRNLISDFSLTYYAQGVKGARRANMAAFQALATRDAYDGWSAVRALQGMEELPNAGHVVASGKLGELTSDGLYTALSNRGNLMSFQHLEQLNAPVTKGVLGAEEREAIGKGPLAALWERTHETKALRAIGGVSEARDHFSRLQHAAQFIIQNIDNTKQYKSMDELLDAASDHTRKWHPDGTDMTRTEQYFRLLIPFYSWQRKAIPLIVESMLSRPGRVISIPKAQYNIAIAMGVDPDSLSDPFPQDQMFPSYMTEQISGPIAEIDGKYYGINPGFAANDILNDWVGVNPFRTLLGSTSPLVRAPFELAAGGMVGTGARINDASDYVDSQTPVLSQLSRMTGTSVTGSLVSMLQGKGLDPQYQIAAGNKDPVAGPALSALNWLTGAGIQNMSQPNQINYAEIEKRNREGEQRGF